MKIVIIKRFLPVFLMVIGFGLVSAQAQTLQQSNGKSKADLQIVNNTNSTATATSLINRINELKSALQNQTQGTPAFVDTMRRISVYKSAATAIQDGDSASLALQAGKTTLYRELESKANEMPLLRLIEQDLQNLLSN